MKGDVYRVLNRDELTGREMAICAQRDRELTEARKSRARQRHLAAANKVALSNTSGKMKRVEGAWEERGLVSRNSRNIRGAAAPLIQHAMANQSTFNSLIQPGQNLFHAEPRHAQFGLELDIVS